MSISAATSCQASTSAGQLLAPNEVNAHYRPESKSHLLVADSSVDSSQDLDMQLKHGAKKSRGLFESGQGQLPDSCVSSAEEVGHGISVSSNRCRPATNDGNPVEEFISGLDQLASSYGYLLPPGDPQLAELEQLIDELEQLQDFHVQSTQPVSCTAAEAFPGVSTDQVRDTASVADSCSSVTEASHDSKPPVLVASKSMEKVKTHPTIAALLMNCSTTVREPFVPLREKPFKPSADLEGSLLYLKNAERENVSLLSISPLPAQPDTRPCMSSDDSKVLRYDQKIADITLQQNMTLSSGESTCKDSDAVEPDVSVRNSSHGDLCHSTSRAVALNQHFWHIIKQKLHAVAIQNQRLANLNVQLQVQNRQLHDEVAYLRNVLANQSAIAKVIQDLPCVNSVRLSSQFGPQKHKAQVEPDDIASCVKRLKSDNLQNGAAVVPPSGICLHIRAGCKIASIELCRQCADMANSHHVTSDSHQYSC